MNSNPSQSLDGLRRPPLSEAEAQTVAEYRRKLYLSLWEKSKQEGVIETFATPKTQRDAEMLLGVHDSGRDIFTGLLKVLCRSGALRSYFDSDGKRVYVASGAQVPDPTELNGSATVTQSQTQSDVPDATGQLSTHQAVQIPGLVFGALKDANVRVQFSSPYEKWWRAALEAPFYASGREMACQDIAKPGDTVLDLACGLGHGLKSLIQAVGPEGHVIGVEVSPHHLNVSRELASRYPNVEIHAADLNDGLPMIPDETIDGTMITGAFHFIYRKEFLLSEIGRVSRPSAKLVIGNCFMDVDVFDREYLDLFFSLIKPKARPITPDLLEDLMSIHGFNIYFQYLIGAFGWYFSEKNEMLRAGSICIQAEELGDR